MANGHVQTQYPCGPRSFSLRVLDDSNAPDIEKGDAIVIDPDEKPVPGRMILVVAQGTIALRKFRPRKHSVELVPLNDDWQPYTLDALTPENFIGVMTELSKPCRKSGDPS